MSEQWLTFADAIEVVRQHIGCTIGRAEATLRAARASGEVRFQNPDNPVRLLADDGIVDLRPRIPVTDERSIAATICSTG